MSIEKALQLVSILIGTAFIVIGGAVFFLHTGGDPIPSETLEFVGTNATVTQAHVGTTSVSTPKAAPKEHITKQSEPVVPGPKPATVTTANAPKKTVQTPGGLIISPKTTASTPPPSPPPPPIETPPPSTPSSIGDLNPNDIMLYTNTERAGAGLPPLAWNTRLSAIAEAKAVDMIEKQYFAHVSPDGVDVAKMADAYGYQYLNIGENLALGDFTSSREVVTGWMNSPGHRANILNTSYKEIGIAAFKGLYEGRLVWYAVQEFGRPLTDCPPPDKLLQQKIALYQGQLDALEVSLDKLKVEIETPGQTRDEYNAKVSDYNTVVALHNGLLETTRAAIAQYNAGADLFNACVGVH